MKPVYPFFRDLHLYAGLFLSPFVVIFAVSVIFLVHTWPVGSGAAPATRTVTDLPLPPALETLKGAEQVTALRAVLDHAGVNGEIGFVRHIPKERRIIMPVTLPGRETTVEVNLAMRSALISTRVTGLADAFVHLHKMPGPHNVAIRGNSAYIQAWRWLADGTVYLLLFVTGSGIYLWAVLKTERRTGLLFLGAGALSFASLVAAVVA